MSDRVYDWHEKGGMHELYVSMHCCGRLYCVMCEKHVEITQQKKGVREVKR